MYHRFKWTKVSHRRNWISREYEPLQPNYLLELAKAVGARVFVDVGANVGVYSVFMGQAVDRVMAYEANAALADEIEGNFALNGIEGAVRRMAVSDQAGTAQFGVVSRYAGNSAVVDAAAGGGAYRAVETVEAVRLSDELATLEGPIVFKIDVEGHEVAVLEGARAVLEGMRCVVQIENFGDAVDAMMAGLHYRKLTSIGPDAYFTNIEDVAPLEIYERAAAALIAANHEDKSMVLRLGGIGLVVSGRVYGIVRKVATRVLGGRI
ncbi:MAG: FkbM family methyltransferase [Pseudomonadota bacterium]